jgi:hypothetical protein
VFKNKTLRIIYFANIPIIILSFISLYIINYIERYDYYKYRNITEQIYPIISIIGYFFVLEFLIFNIILMYKNNVIKDHIVQKIYIINIIAIIVVFISTIILKIIPFVVLIGILFIILLLFSYYGCFIFGFLFLILNICILIRNINIFSIMINIILLLCVINLFFHILPAVIR